MITEPTETLESELKSLATQIETGKQRFHKVSEELKLRREYVKASQDPLSDQPQAVELTEAQDLQQQLDAAHKEQRVLTNKLIAMESEQAKLVIEIEMLKVERDVALERLATLAKTYFPKTNS
jgi:hypothetical protein